MSKQKEWDYSWGSWEATISKHPRRDEYQWSVTDADGNDTYDFYSGMESMLETPLQAEYDMFREVSSIIGYLPTKQVNK